MENNNNKQKIDMVILQHLKEKEKDGKLDESDDDDDDNMIMEMEEMMKKENIGCSEQMKVPSIGSVKESIEKNKKKESSDKKEKKEKNEKKSIFEKNENEKISKAKKAVKELEMLMDKRVEMKKQKKGKQQGMNKNKKKNKDSKKESEMKEENDCEVVTSARQREKGKGSMYDSNRFGLGYQLNGQCLMMNGKQLNIPNMRNANPFENLINRQKVMNGDGAILRRGSKNYSISNLSEHVDDSESKRSGSESNDGNEDDDDDDDDEMGQQDGKNGDL